MLEHLWKIHITFKITGLIVNFYWNTILMDKSSYSWQFSWTFCWNAYKTILCKQAHFSHERIKSLSTVNDASRALKEHLMSLEDFRIKYNVQTKNITKSVSFKLEHLWILGAFLTPEFFSQNVILIYPCYFTWACCHYSSIQFLFTLIRNTIYFYGKKINMQSITFKWFYLLRKKCVVAKGARLSCWPLPLCSYKNGGK